MGNDQSSPPRSPPAKVKKSIAITDPCDVIAMVKSCRNSNDKFKELIQTLIYKEGDVNAIGEHGMTALHFAVLNADELIIKALIVLGADCNAKNEFDQTPLDMAIDNRKEDLVPLLVSVGCQRGTVNISPSNSLSSCCSNGSSLSDLENLPSNECLRKKSSQLSLVGESPVTMGMKRADSSLSTCLKLEEYMKSKFEASMSIGPNEAYVYVLQEQEIQRFRSTKTSDMDRVSPPPLEFKIKGGCRILTLDGGGMRGLIQLDILSEIEKMTGKPIVELFDWIIGNSVGGIIALGLVYRGMSIAHLRKLFFKLKDDVFSNKGLGFSYNTKFLEKLLQDELGMEKRMCDVKHPKVVITAVDKTSTPLSIHYFNNCFEDQFSNQPIWKVARYTSAAPVYFNECDNYVDGGVLANNPCEGGLSQMQAFYHNHNQKLAVACMVSVGSGIFPEGLGSIGGEGIGFFSAGRNLLRLFSDALGQSENIAERCKASCAAQDIPFYRFSPPLDKKVEPTETDSRKLIDIMITSRINMHTREDYKLDKLVPLLLVSDMCSNSPRLSR